MRAVPPSGDDGELKTNSQKYTVELVELTAIHINKAQSARKEWKISEPTSGE